jgi:hypothetical protein
VEIVSPIILLLNTTGVFPVEEIVIVWRSSPSMPLAVVGGQAAALACAAAPVASSAPAPRVRVIVPESPSLDGLEHVENKQKTANNKKQLIILFMVLPTFIFPIKKFFIDKFPYKKY